MTKNHPEIGRCYRVWLGSGFTRIGKIVERDQDGRLVYIEWVEYPELRGDWVLADDCN